jgi:two-component system, NtrC family, sensor kinase
MVFTDKSTDEGFFPNFDRAICQFQENQEGCWRDLAEKLMQELAANRSQLQQAIAQNQQMTVQNQQLRDKLEESEARNDALIEAASAQAQQFSQNLKQLRQNQAQIIQAEKMASLGQLVAGVAHEINNPVNFIYGNLPHAAEYVQDLVHLLELYQQHYPTPAEKITATAKAIDLDFLVEDLSKLLMSMRVGAERIQKIVVSLRNFSRLDEAEMKAVDIHEGIESTLMILQARLKAKANHPAIRVVKEYGNLPLVECYAGQLNQVLTNILVNAIDALNEQDQKRSIDNQKQEPNTIRIVTELLPENQIAIRISDNGVGIPEEAQNHIFDPFFTTKPVGKGTGMGMSISYQIVAEKHGGLLYCHSVPGEGTEFVIQIPIQQQLSLARRA